MDQLSQTLLNILLASIGPTIALIIYLIRESAKQKNIKVSADASVEQAKATQMVNESQASLELIKGLGRVADSVDRFAATSSAATDLFRESMEISTKHNENQQAQLTKLINRTDDYTLLVGKLNTTLTDALSATTTQTGQRMEQIEGFAKESAATVLKELEPMKKDISTIFEQIDGMKTSIGLLLELATKDAEIAATLKETTQTLSNQLDDLRKDVKLFVDNVKPDEPAGVA